MPGSVLVWLRRDLRLADNPALHAAAQSGAPVAFLYVLDETDPWPLGGAQKWWLHGSLEAFGARLAAAGCALTLRRGDPARIVPETAAKLGARTVFWNRAYAPHEQRQEAAVTAALRNAGAKAEGHKAALMFEPSEIANQAGEPFKVFSAFWRACLRKGVHAEALPAPSSLRPAPALPGDALESWALLPTKPDWAGGLRATWTPGEAGAQTALHQFLAGLRGYAANRDRPDLQATSSLSPFLHWGEISPLQVWRAIDAATAAEPALRADAEKFRSELGWREFSHHLLHHWPTLPTENWRDAFDAFPWADDEEAFGAWARGRTGYPIVDAGMRQLWATGWMHNRVRMVVASFLVKDLLIDWRRGQAWFWDTLVDADLANNSASWQWVAGSGADAAPYFRVFNPVTQGERYDPSGDYVRRWVPELAKLAAGDIHAPWLASKSALAAAGVTLGDTYPLPVVDHARARDRALRAFDDLSNSPR